MLDKAAIRARIPHAGAMCLPERVERWDEEGLDCLAENHRDPANPLRESGRLGAVCAIEYAAQAMALHGALCAGGAAPPGFLAALRAVELRCDRLDLLPAPLVISVRRLGGDAGGFIYSFAVSAGGRQVAEGRATVMQQRTPAP